MGIIDIFLIGVGLSMDAFAVSICKGLKMKTIDIKAGFIIALFFGGFQAFMPTVGWLLGISFQKYIEAFDHWIAFVLLVLIGGNMIRGALAGDEEDEDKGSGFKIDFKELVLMAVATSIDALAVGIAFASLGADMELSIGASVGIIGVTTFVISIAGVIIGNVFGTRYQKKAEVIGGVILIIIGIKILLEHLGIF